jgi:hypothetical protein
LDFKINFREVKAMRRTVASVISLLCLASLASSALASEEAVLKCKWVATGMVENHLRLIEGKEFEFPVDLERGFFYYLENGMESEQKEALLRAGKEFLKQVEQLKSKGKVSAPAGLKCVDEAAKEGVVLLYFKE